LTFQNIRRNNGRIYACRVSISIERRVQKGTRRSAAGEELIFHAAHGFYINNIFYLFFNVILGVKIYSKELLTESVYHAMMM
jgi:hypothetical protein